MNWKVEPLELCDGRWRADVIAVSVYPSITDLEIVPVSAHEAGGIGQTGGWYTLDSSTAQDDFSQYSPQAYHEEIIL